MSDVRRVIRMYANTGTNQLVNAGGSVLPGGVSVFRRSQLLYVCDLLQADGSTPFAPEAGCGWSFIIDNNLDESVPDLIVSNSDQFNIAGDRADLDVANGKISFRVDTATLQLAAAMTDVESLGMVAELRMLPVGGEPSLLIQFPVTVLNIYGNVGADAGLIYCPTNVLKFDGNDLVALYPDGSVAQRWVHP